MRKKLLYIGILVANALLFAACGDHEQISSYEEIIEADLVPMLFTPYVGTNTDDEATTRADVNYLSYLRSGNTYGMDVFNQFPWFNPTTKEYSQQTFRFGNYGNSYIVGMYGFYGQNSWDDKDDESLTANFMTNQPLLHTSSSQWEYSPLRYWPNTQGAKVTFVSYYPFQDYEGKEYFQDGLNNCIVPPGNNAVGPSSYKFTFTQKEELDKQVDFLLGINTDVTKQSVSSGNINLNLRHTLCAVAFDIRTGSIKQLEDGTSFSGDVRYEINSISLEGLYGKAKVYPTYEDSKVVINWDEYENDNTKYTLAFNDASMFNNKFTRPTFDGDQQRINRAALYNNDKNSSKGTVIIDGNTINYGSDIYGASNSRNMKYLMLVIPQKAETDKDGNLKDSFLTVNYDFSYTVDGQKFVYKNCEEKIKLSDTQFQEKTYRGQLFRPGVFVTFNIRIQGLKSILMDAYMEEWIWDPEDGNVDIEG